MKLPFGVLKSWGYGKNISRAKSVPAGISGPLIEVELPESDKSKAKPVQEKDPGLHFTIQHYGSQGHQHGSGNRT